MCGILGIYGFEDKNKILRAGKLIEHRGPDMHGYYFDKNVQLFHRRLSIIDLTKKGKQPILNEDKNLVIICNGEIYNYSELKEKLKKNHSFYTDTDTEVILHLYEEYGGGCCNILEGDFAFVIWDSKKREIFCARDKIGVKPFY